MEENRSNGETELIGHKDEEFHQERFIPVTRFALVEHLKRYEEKTNAADKQADRDMASCADLFPLMALWRHYCYQQQLEKVRGLYLPFSPDRDTLRMLPYSDEQLSEMKDQLIDHICHLLERANYVKIDEDKLETLLQANSAHGLELNVDLSEFDELLLYSRGHETTIIEKRTPNKLYLVKERFEVPVYRRIFLLLNMKSEETRLQEIMQEKHVGKARAKRILRHKRKNLPKDSNFVHLRLFKNIPQEDLEMMFPNTEVRLKLFDKIKLGVTAGGGTVAGVGSAASKLMAAIAAANPITLAATITGVIGLISRQVMKVFNTRTKYMMQLAQRLFFHALANNRGALMLLSDRAEEEDFKEDILLYFFLLRHPSHREDLKEHGRLDRIIEDFIANEFSVDVNYDLEDAVDRLKRDGIVREDQAGLFTALDPEELREILKKKLLDLISAISETPQETLASIDA